jgi:PhnB protein
MADVKPIPDDYPQLVPYLCVDGANAAIDFYRTVFGAIERMRMPEPDGKLGHAEVGIGSAVIMLSDEFPALGIRAPSTIGGTPVTLSLYVEDVDKVFLGPSMPAPPPYARSPISSTATAPARFEDPFGHRWSVATRIENLSPQEMAERGAAAARD